MSFVNYCFKFLFALCKSSSGKLVGLGVNVSNVGEAIAPPKSNNWPSIVMFFLFSLCMLLL